MLVQHVLVVAGHGADFGALLVLLCPVDVWVVRREGVVGCADDGTDCGGHCVGGDLVVVLGSDLDVPSLRDQ